MEGTITSQPGPDAPAPDPLFQSALCGVDGTLRSYAAVEQAAALVGAGGRLTLLAVTATGSAGESRSAAISPKRAERVLAHARQLARHAGADVTTEIEPEGPAQRVILERAADHDLLALGAPWISWLGGLILEGVASAALGAVRTPVLAARAVPGGIERFAERILLASDASDESDELVEMAIAMALPRSGHVTLLHVAGVESRSRPHHIEAQGARLADALTGGSEVRVEVGDPDDEIVDVAGVGGNTLVVMGSRRASGVSALGSVSRKVLHNAHCSVLLVPPGDR